MGAFASRRNAGVEQVDIASSNAYRYPPKSGCYFGSHFFMGGQRFDTMQPEAYLFGSNTDLNYLGNRPIPFPYPAPQPNEPTKTLKSLVNIRKDSLKFVKIPEDELGEKKEENEEGEERQKTCKGYNIEFTFDTDVRCAITVYYFATEEINNGLALYHPRDPKMNSETYHYKKGANQVFSQSTHIINPSAYSEEEWQYNPDKEVFPIVIQCVVEEEEYIGHSHMTFATVDQVSDGGYALKPLKQKQMVDGLCYLLQDIYGIENKNSSAPKDEDIDDSGSECIVCMSDIRDTLILPCRHLCLCHNCADSLRYQANNCPICRKTFHALLQLRALRKKTAGAQQTPREGEDNSVDQEGVPPGYEAVALIEALNGPSSQVTNPPVMPPDGENPNLDKILHDGVTLGQRPSHLVVTLPYPPEGSPPSKTKMERTGSTHSKHSVRREEAMGMERDVEEGAEASGGTTTPEIPLSKEPLPEPSKSPGSGKKPYRKDHMEAINGGEDTVQPLVAKDSVEVVDEMENQKVSAVKEPKEDEPPALPETPPPDYEDTDSPHQTFKPAAHATVMYDQPEKDAPGLNDSHGSMGSLPSQVVDPSDMPAGSTDSSVSSYSSTSSTKVLLSHSSSPSKAKEDPVA